MTNDVTGDDISGRANKRRRSDRSLNATQAYGAPLRRFQKWCKEQGIVIDPRLELRLDGNEIAWSISVHAASTISNDEVVVTIPKTAVLSRKSSALAPHFDEESSGESLGLELALCLLFERCLGIQSRFEPYIGILPRLPVKLPLVIEDDDEDETWKWAQGTEADRLTRRSKHAHAEEQWPWAHDYGMSRQFALDYFHTTGIAVLAKSGLFLPEHSGHLEGLASAFLTAYTHVSSRDFIVDTYHGVGLVPLADLFNHAESHNVHFESDQDVCEFCGIALLTGHAQADCLRTPTPSEEADDIYGPDTLDIRTLSDLAEGQEMFNTYGSLSNALLLTRYGFCLDTDTDFERYTFDLRFPRERTEFESIVPAAELQSALALIRDSLQDSDANDVEDDSDADGDADVDALDELHTLTSEETYLLCTESPLHDLLCDLARQTDASSEEPSKEEVDDDLIDRDVINPLFVNATGQISTVLFALIYLIHYRAESTANRAQELKPIVGSIETSHELVCKTVKTLSSLLELRLSKLYYTFHVETALHLLQDPDAAATAKACIHHASQEHAALQAGMNILNEFQFSSS